MSFCSYCRGPITGAGHTGRPWPNHAAATYCCYGCLSLGEQRRQEGAAPTSTQWKLDGLGLRLGASILIVGQSMIFGLALNLHDDVPAGVRWFAQTAILAATLLVVALLGGPLFRAAWSELRRGRLTLEALFLLTMSGAMAASLQAHLTGHGHIYFEVVSILLVVYTLGKVVGSRSRAAALASSRAWADQLNTCRLVDAHGQSRVVPVAEVVPGDVIEVNPGETVAVDGTILAGVGFLSEAPVSGEPFAVVRRPGDRVLAGTACYDATLSIRAATRGAERQVDRLLRAVEQARGRPVSVQAQADRLGRVFIPLIVLTAFATFTYWTFFTAEGWEAGLFNAMSVLLVACPCVIGLATPIVIWSALGRLAERGLIVRAGDAVERLAEVDRVMLDKTGTLTDDSFALLDVATVASGEERARLLGWLSLIEERSRHPVARAFARLPRPFTAATSPCVTALRFVPGCGVDAEIEDTGRFHAIQIGTPEWVGRSNRCLRDLPAQLRATGHRIDVAVDGEIAAVAVLAEQLRDSARETLAAFAELDLPVQVLTGDSTERAVALNLPRPQGGLQPDDKLAAIESARARGGTPLYVGDGINDASALAAAHAGVALSSGADIAVGAATLTLYHHDLRVLPWAIALSREAVRAVQRNLNRAVLYNLVGMTLAACGLLHPVVAALLMVASSLMLVFSSTRVGAAPVHCKPARPMRRPGTAGLTPAVRRAFAHGLAFALQGAALLALLDSARAAPFLILGAFAACGIGLGWLWQRWSTIPHLLDMCVGMLTLGNLGMLLGWWADVGFAPIADGGCCHCVATMRDGLGQPWMWIGMLVGANAAMLWLRRSDSPLPRRHATAMCTGGNVGMVLGMLSGGWSAAQLTFGSVPLAATISLGAMTVGMLAGMLFGAWMGERVIALAQAIPTLPRWFRAGVTDRAG